MSSGSDRRYFGANRMLRRPRTVRVRFEPIRANHGLKRLARALRLVSDSADNSHGSEVRQDDRIIISNGVDLAVGLQVQPLTRVKPLVVAKVQGAAAVASFVGNAEKLYQCVYDHPGLARLMFDSVPLLQALSEDLQAELDALCGSFSTELPTASEV